ncbi:TetR/AcrR family transcriptional regulator [Actinomadura nitritigenes]|uniref:TetR/AcrR family transcriptional regulator n=1 Tax=Actinomadura nitritigenes TaxID=134602 RepID=A0ABS3REA9_9ACTN|nr:TetR/AcrR family transcriptional regulator [Actinomadura nitritigenes]MBO2443948.1 TetR/AcrR family transcriptional regulator [Actinomadura nitritigenes]
MTGEAKARRRGTALEAAILDAVWDELDASGYAGLTIENVAARARTGKQVIYRRWPRRADLVLAALRYRYPSIADDVPDTGSLRGDVLAVLRRMAQRFGEFGPDLVHGLMAEAHELDPGTFEVIPDAMSVILRRAADRGEVAPGAVSPRLARMPADLVRHEMLLTDRPVPDEVLTEIVDELFLPLVRARRRNQREEKAPHA